MMASTYYRYHRQIGQLSEHPLRSEPMNLLGSFATHRPSREAIFNAFVQSSTGRGIPKSRRLGEINLEVIVSPSEAVFGGSLPIDIPLARLCTLCNGTGRTGFFRCDACGGEGMTRQDARVDILLPQGAADGTLIPISLDHLDINAIGLNVHVRVAGL
jgi:DnaJ-class molecular chaperone